ncbi:MAG: hypothetical protein ABI652_04030 [Acidobacteriota bacterium]
MASLDTVLDPERVTAAALSWPAKARALTITSGDDYTRVSATLKDIKALRAEVDAAFDDIIADANKVHKTACSKKREAETPLIEAERVIKAALVQWDTEQERARAIEQRRVEEVERRRLEDERINLAAHMETEGNKFGDAALVEEAHELIAQPIVPVVAPVAKTTPVVTGQSFSTTYSARLDNLLQLVKFVAANPSFVGLLSANMPALNAQARSLKEHMKIPGVTAVATRNASVRR